MTPFLRYGAVFSPCATHDVCTDPCCKQRPWRYTLVREFPFCSVERVLLVIALNPSTADLHDDDATIRRLMHFTRVWGFSELVVCNAFAWRSTDRSVLKQLPDPVGPDNDQHLLEQAKRAAQVLVAWGNDGVLRGRDREVMALLKSIDVTPWCFKVTKTNQPEHPLYQRNDAQLIRYEAA